VRFFLQSNKKVQGVSSGLVSMQTQPMR